MFTLYIFVRGQKMTEHYDTLANAVASLDVLQKEYKRRGYKTYRPTDVHMSALKGGELDTVAFIRQSSTSPA